MRVIVVNADGLPAWALGAYGNEWIATPNLDELAAQSVIFDQHFADVPRQLSPTTIIGRHTFPKPPNMAEQDRQPISLFLKPRRVDVLRAAPDELDLLDRLKEQVNVLLWQDAPRLLPPWDVEIEHAPADMEPWLDPKPGWLDPANASAFDRLQQSFAAVVEAFDTWFGAWLRTLARTGLLDRSLVIITSGRGQNLGEHGLIGEARPCLHEEMVHLPLIVRLPAAQQGGRRVSHLTQTIDLAPTILSHLGIPVPTDWHGHDLLPLCRGAGPVRDYAVTGLRGAGTEFALQTTDVKIIVPDAAPAGDPPRPPKYFVKPDDRWEVNDLRQPNIDDAEHLEKTLRAYLAASEEPGPLIVPPLRQQEISHADSQARGREHDQPESQSGVR